MDIGPKITKEQHSSLSEAGEHTYMRGLKGCRGYSGRGRRQEDELRFSEQEAKMQWS